MVCRVVIADSYKNYSEHTNAVCGKYAVYGAKPGGI